MRTEQDVSFAYLAVLKDAEEKRLTFIIRIFGRKKGMRRTLV